MQQHLHAKHKKTDVGAYSVSLKDQRTGMEVTQTHGTKRKSSPSKDYATKKSREVSILLFSDNVNTVYIAFLH